MKEKDHGSPNRNARIEHEPSPHYLTSVGGSEMRIYSSANDFSRSVHELLGMSVFALTHLMRVCWRAIFSPPTSPEMPVWMELGAKLGLWTLYVLLVLVPLTAILGAWLEGHPLTLPGVGNIQPWVPQSRHVGLTLADIHVWLSNVLVWLAGLHAAAALLAARYGPTFHVARPVMRPRRCPSRNIPLRAPSQSVAVPPRVSSRCVYLTRSLPITYDSKGGLLYHRVI
jgi:cytochrome b561